MDTQVTLASDDSITVRTVELGHVLRVFLQDVHLHGPALGKPGVADVALVWFLSRVCPHVSLQLVRVSAGVAAQAALEWTLTGVRPNVTLQLTHLDTSVVTHGAFEGFLMCVFVPTVTNQLPTSDKGHIAVCALVRASSSVCVEVVSQQSDCPEGPST